MPAPDNFAIIGSVDAIRSLLFGLTQHDAHVLAFKDERWSRIVAEQNERVRRAIVDRRAREDVGDWS